MKEMVKKQAIFLLKYCIGFVLLGWALWRVDLHEMLMALSQLSLSAILITLIINALNLTAQFFRWKYLVENQSAHFRAQDLLPSFFAGFALRNMVPGGHAEISKVFLLPGKKSGKIMAFGIEKFFQTYFKFVMILIGLPLVFSEHRPTLWGLAVIGVAAFFVLPFLGKTSLVKRLEEKQVNYRRLMWVTLLYTLLSFLCLVCQFYLLLNNNHVIGFWAVFLVTIFILGAGLAPISISGLGVRENLAVFFLARYAIPAHTAVSISLLTFFLNTVAPAIIGSVVIYHKRHALKEAGVVIKNATKSLYDQGKQQLNGWRTNARDLPKTDVMIDPPVVSDPSEKI